MKVSTKIVSGIGLFFIINVSVGVITFEMLTGRRPFTEQTVPAVLRSIVEDELHLPGEGAAIRRLESVLRWSVAKDPKDRARSAELLRNELVRALRDCPPIVFAVGSSSSNASALPGDGATLVVPECNPSKGGIGADCTIAGA